MRNRRPNVGQQKSPCVKVCRIEGNFCTGCYRTIDEIRDWMVMSDYEQQKLLHELKWRKHVGDYNT
jgi:predicted Fe-S protein YdhL (DUF1289 family)